MHFMSLRNTGLEVYSHGKLSLAKMLMDKVIFFTKTLTTIGSALLWSPYNYESNNKLVFKKHKMC